MRLRKKCDRKNSVDERRPGNEVINLNRICLTRIDIIVRNGRVNKKSTMYYELINQTLISCVHDSHYEGIVATVLSQGACNAYDMFIDKYPNSKATIIIKLSHFVKSHQKESGTLSDASYTQIDIQHILDDDRHVENCYIDISEDFQTYIFNTLCNMNFYCQKDKLTFKPQYISGGIVFRNKAAAILIHEFSHLFEADIYLYSRNFINEINRCIELNDLYHHASLPAICLAIDDEFSLNRDVTIIEKGIIKNILVDKKWSQIYHTDLYGNGRRVLQENAPILPRMRISYMKYRSKLLIDRVMDEIKDYIVVDNMNSGKLITKEGTVIFQVEAAQYHHCDEVIYLKPFSIQCPIMEIINHIICVSKDNYYAVYPCGKSGYQLPCGIITPSNILTKGGNIHAL